MQDTCPTHIAPVPVCLLDSATKPEQATFEASFFGCIGTECFAQALACPEGLFPQRSCTNSGNQYPSPPAEKAGYGQQQARPHQEIQDHQKSPGEHSPGHVHIRLGLRHSDAVQRPKCNALRHSPYCFQNMDLAHADRHVSDLYAAAVHSDFRCRSHTITHFAAMQTSTTKASRESG